VFDQIVKEHANDLMHSGRDKTWAEIDCKYYGVTKMEVAFLLEHCTTCAMTTSGKTVAPLQSIIVKELWEHLQIDFINFRTTDNKRIICSVVKLKHGSRYGLQCQYGILQGLYQTKNKDCLCATIPHQIPAYKKGSHRELTLLEAAHL